MALSKRIFIFYFLFVALCGYFMVHLFSRQVYPSIRQTTEETLVDTANFLAEMVSDDLHNDRINAKYLEQRMNAYQARDPKANIWDIPKDRVRLNVYITDRNGIVLFDSLHQAEGQDYSQWRDVYLTLKGQYGARSTKHEDELFSTMYVAAPIEYNDEIIGVLTVSKPNDTTNMYVNNAKSELVYFALILLTVSIICGAILSWWLGISFRKLIDYAKKLGKGERENQPKFYGKDMNVLATTLSNLREELDGKEYVERYVNTLTHELKSPLAAIRGASELLQNDMDEVTRQHFLHNIDRESERLQNLIDRVLKLSIVEQRQRLENIQSVHLNQLVSEVLQSFSPLIENKNLTVDMTMPHTLKVDGDEFLLRQALTNVIHNAIDFMPENGLLTVKGEKHHQWVELDIYNEGSPIPEYALSRLYERFYSLPRPDSGEKSTGLGLNFVKEIIALHKGEIWIENRDHGVNVSIKLLQGRVV